MPCAWRAESSDALHRIAHLGGGAGDNGDVGPRLGEGEPDAEPEPAPAARDERDPPVETQRGDG